MARKKTMAWIHFTTITCAIVYKNEWFCWKYSSMNSFGQPGPAPLEKQILTEIQALYKTNLLSLWQPLIGNIYTLHFPGI